MPNLMDELQVYGQLLTGVDYDIVTIHPLADEPELLAKLNLSAEQIPHCDLYWVFNNRLFFVSVGRAFNSSPLVSYHRRLDIEHGHSFWVNTNVFPLTKSVINRCLHYLAAWIESHENILSETDKEAFEFQNLPDDDESPTSTEPLIISDNDIFKAN